VQDTVGEVRRDVAHSPSWRRRCSGRKSGLPAKCPPPSTLLHRLSEQPGTRWAAHSCEIASALVHQARKLMGLPPQTIKLRPGRANTPLGLFRRCDNLSHVNHLNPAFDLVGPEAAGRREVEVDSVAGEPAFDGRRFMGGVIVEDGVHQLAGRHGALDGVEDEDEFLMGMAIKHLLGTSFDHAPGILSWPRAGLDPLRLSPAGSGEVLLW